ncbi:protein RETARDED ROOT GROWTH, mitochondrial isoform X1 [Nicotiana tomentosiformis]|uniref:protein RETARDED ROOT GROWTH, mitochondrial isoform X1 n=2 Tax=Nicotiana tomentosiformis TaxID=4098 RepID=UPI00051BD76A|nr:uncharacterized protein LOC104111113 [Nicotiana tomentosiformis]
MGRWRAATNFVARIVAAKSRSIPQTPLHKIHIFSSSSSVQPRIQFLNFRSFSAAPATYPQYVDDFEYNNNAHKLTDDEEIGIIPVKAYFLCTSIDLKRMQAENSADVLPSSSRSPNHIALRFLNLLSQNSARGFGEKTNNCSYMVVFQYGSAVLFNVEDDDVEYYLQIVRRYASGLLREMKKDDYAVKEKPLLVEDMQGGADHIVLKKLDTDSIRIIGSVLGQSIALDYFVSQVDGMVEEFAGINREMEKTGTFTMDRKKLFQLVGKANSNIADVILKVGLFERSEIAWRDAKYAQILEYLREEYEVSQRFGNLNFKLKFVEHNIHFLQEVLQNRKSDLLEWCIIVLLAVENVVCIYEIVRDSTAIPM